MSRGSPPQGRLRDHDHSRAGEGGNTLADVDITADDLNLDDGDTLDLGTDDDISLSFDPNQGANGALVVRDANTGEDRLRIPIGAAAQLVSQNFDVNSQDLEDGAQTLYDATAGEFLNAVVAGLANLGANDAFSAYPLLPADVFQLANLADGEQFSAYPLESADVDESTIAVTDFEAGTVADQEFLQNNGGTLTGSTVASTAKDVLRNRSGVVQLSQAGTSTVTVTSSGVAQTAKYTTTRRALFTSVKAGVSQLTGAMTIKRDGATVASTGAITSGGTLSYSGTPRTDSPTWTLSASFTNRTVNSAIANGGVIGGTTGNSTQTTTVTGSGVAVKATLHGDAAGIQAPWTGYLYINGTLVTQAGKGFDDTITYTLSGQTTSPVVTGRMHRDGGTTAQLDSVGAFLLTNPKATISPYINDLTTVE